MDIRIRNELIAAVREAFAEGAHGMHRANYCLLLWS